MDFRVWLVQSAEIVSASWIWRLWESLENAAMMFSNRYNERVMDFRVWVVQNGEISECIRDLCRLLRYWARHGSLRLRGWVVQKVEIVSASWIFEVELCRSEDSERVIDLRAWRGWVAEKVLLEPTVGQQTLGKWHFSLGVWVGV